MKRKTSSRVIKTLILMFSLCLCSCGNETIVFDNTLERKAYQIGVNYDESNLKADYIYPDNWDKIKTVYRLYEINGFGKASEIKDLYPGNIVDVYFKNSEFDHAIVRPFWVLLTEIEISETTGQVILKTSNSFDILHYDSNQYVINKDKSITCLQDEEIRQLKVLYCSYKNDNEKKEQYNNSNSHYFINQIYSFYPESNAGEKINCKIIGEPYGS